MNTREFRWCNFSFVKIFMAAVIWKLSSGHLGRKFDYHRVACFVMSGLGYKACHQNTDQSVMSAVVAQVQEYNALLVSR